MAYRIPFLEREGPGRRDGGTPELRRRPHRGPDSACSAGQAEPASRGRGMGRPAQGGAAQPQELCLVRRIEPAQVTRSASRWNPALSSMISLGWRSIGDRYVEVTTAAGMHFPRAPAASFYKRRSKPRANRSSVTERTRDMPSSRKTATPPANRLLGLLKSWAITGGFAPIFAAFRWSTGSRFTARGKPPTSSISSRPASARW